MSTLALHVITESRYFLTHPYLEGFPIDHRAETLRALVEVAVGIESGVISLGDALSMMHRIIE